MTKSYERRNEAGHFVAPCRRFSGEPRKRITERFPVKSKTNRRASGRERSEKQSVPQHVERVIFRAVSDVFRTPRVVHERRQGANQILAI